MRRTAALLIAAAAAASLATSSPASASLYCSDLGPVPGYGPVCTVKCVLGSTEVPPEVNPKDPIGTVADIVLIVCPA